MSQNGLKSSQRLEIVHPSYQLSKEELDEDMRVEKTFEEAVQALTRPVKIRYIQRPKDHR